MCIVTDCYFLAYCSHRSRFESTTLTILPAFFERKQLVPALQKLRAYYRNARHASRPMRIHSGASGCCFMDTTFSTDNVKAEMADRFHLAISAFS